MLFKNVKWSWDQKAQNHYGKMAENWCSTYLKWHCTKEPILMTETVKLSEQLFFLKQMKSIFSVCYPLDKSRDPAHSNSAGFVRGVEPLYLSRELLWLTSVSGLGSALPTPQTALFWGRWGSVWTAAAPPSCPALLWAEAQCSPRWKVGGQEETRRS